MKLHAGQYEQALATLVRARRNAGRHPHVLDLLQQAYCGLKDWDQLAGLLPELKKYKVLPPEELQALEVEVYTQLLASAASRGEGEALDKLRSDWQKMPANLKQNSALVCSYAELLIKQGAHAAAEKVILRALKGEWDPDLVRLYGYVEGDSPARQLAQAEGWLVVHPQDAQLLLCVGRLSARDKLWGKARDYFESSYRLERSAEVCAELGRLLTSLGEPKVAAAYFREGLLMRESTLPELPMPEKVVPQARRLANS
jgi:HemY protein